LTQFGRALKALGIHHIHAYSPQAKGRVERSNRTHQDRLLKALREQGISSIKDANRFLEELYCTQHNMRFTQCEGLSDIHRPANGIDLDNIFCWEETRKVYNDYTITLPQSVYSVTSLRSTSAASALYAAPAAMARWLFAYILE
jgi:hypothetical protein